MKVIETDGSENRASNGINTGTPGVTDTRTGLEVAVIGMSGRFPGAENINQFWENLKNGVESLSFLTDRELKDSGLPENMLENPGYVKTRGGVLGHKDYFDAFFFDYTPFEAELLNPQTRIFYECSWEALENAAYNPFTGNQVIGIYAGAEPGFYWEAMATISGKTNVLGEFTSSLLTRENTLCTRVSYHLNLKGPAVAVQTACSTSLAAIHIACQALLNGECNIALAGGVTVLVLPGHGYLYQEGMVMSPDGHCRAFDAKAKGMASGEGCGVVVLKLLEQAINDRDFIHAMIKGTALNNDGIRKVGYTAPSVVGQAEAIKVAQTVAEVEPESITYVETHGTATVLGDPIEIQALKQAFNTNKKQYCAVGSVKSNVGHLGSAAGVTGFIKTVLALKHRLIPPSLHFETPNPGISFENSPFYVNTKLQPWKSEGYPLRAGVSSFGIGGTNAHVILEEVPGGTRGLAPLTDEQAPCQGRGGVSPPSPSRQYQLILLSAKTESALDKMTENLAEYFEKNVVHPGNTAIPGAALADTAYTLQVGRQALQNRKILVCFTGEEVVEILSTPASQRVYTGQVQNENPPVIFVFSGLGGQYVNMGRDLYEKEPYFRQQMDCCFEILNGLLDYDIKEILYPGNLSPVNSPLERGAPEGRGVSSNKIHQVEIAQVVVFIFEYALATLLMRWGIKPYAMIGYSFGEYTAACIAGLFSLADGLKLVTTRGQLLGKIPGGMMLSVPLAKEELITLLPANLSLAIDNGPSCVVAGTAGAVAAFEKEMKARKCLTMRLPASHAVHSYMMEPILKEFEEAAAGITWQELETPYISNVTGDWIDVQQVSAPSYWAKHLRETVCFARGLQQLLKEPNAVFVEVGPGRDIRALVSRAMEINSNNNSNNRQSHHQRRVINLVLPQQKEIPDNYYLLHKLGILWLLGVSINWQNYHGDEKRYRLPLPTYPFEKHRFWTVVEDYQTKKPRLGTGMSGTAVPGKSREPADWFYVPLWKRQKILHVNRKGDVNNGNASLCWWVFVDDFGWGERLVNELKKGKGQQHRLVTIQIGPAYKKQNSSLYTINPAQYEDYRTLLADLASQGSIPDRIVHLWGVSSDNNEGIEPQSIEGYNDLGFYSLLYLAKVLGQNKDYTGEIGIDVVTNHMQSVTGEENLSPGKATVLGPCRVIPQEYPGITCKSIDVSNWQNQGLVQRLLEEVKQQNREPLVAYRGTQRWVQTFEAVHLEERELSTLLREKGVYLITGGLGDIGYTLAEYLIKRVSGKVILTGRSQLPAREMWTRYLNNSDKEDRIYQDIRKLHQLLELSGEVLYFSADVADRRAMQEAIQQGEEQFGPINGVIHSAGIIRGESFKSIHDITPAECQEQFQAKIYGLMVLEGLLQGKQLDFGLMISSLSTVLGGLGFSAYSAANHFMDTFCAKHNQENQLPWIVVDWEGTNKEDTVDAFHRILSSDPLEQVIFSIGGDLKARISRWVKLKGISREKKKNRSTPIRSRPALLNPYLPPRHTLEEKLADIWQNFFGIDKIGVTDDLFDLGGDSLKMITLIAIIQKELQVTIPLKEFFDHPTIEGVARYIKDAETEEYIPISPAETKQYYILTSVQKRLYFLQHMEENTVAYNSPQVVLLEGRPDQEQLQQNVRQMIRRHESLRTCILMVEEQPVQVIHDKEAIDFFIEYYDSLTEHPLTGSTQDIIKNFIRPFDLSRPPFLRLGLIKIEEDQHILMFDIHHIVMDGVSYEIFVKELMILYAGEELPPLEIQYKDYSEWQTSLRQQETLVQQEAYWLSQFQTGGDIPLLALPYDYPRPMLQSFAGDVLGFRLSEEETRALRKITAEENVTLYMILMTIFNIFLFKLSGQEDIVVGTPVAGRRRAELESIIGVFINTLPIRNYPRGEKTWQAFLQEVKQVTLQAFENQDYQFEDLVDKLVIHRDTGRNPLFDALFVSQVSQARTTRTGIPEIQLPALKLKPLGYQAKTAKFDLTLDMTESRDHLLMHFEYCTRLFKKETLQRFIKYFKRITASVIDNLQQNISDLDILSEEEKQQLLMGFNQTRAVYPQDKTLHQLFTGQVEQTPDYIALKGPAVIKYKTYMTYITCLSYRELNEKSNQLADLLLERGVQPDTIVGMMAERYLETVIGILAILKAGGAYLPIDPVYPEERIIYMLKDSSAKILVTAPGLSEKFEKLSIVNCQLLMVNEMAPKRRRFNNPPKETSPHLHLQPAPVTCLAYVIYTSGTTGKPKGTLIQHDNVVQLLASEPSRFDFNSRDVWTLFHSFCFDFSVWEMFGALLYGGKLILVDRNTTRDPVAFLKQLKRVQITVLNQTPPAFYHLMHQELKTANRELNLRYVIFGGEALQPARLREWRAKYPGTHIINMFGITETTVHVTFKEINQHEIQTNVSNIGTPLPSLMVYVMDKEKKLVPMGVPGECFVGGASVGRGYLNRSQFTAEKFIVNPYKPGEILYRSGDLVRLNPEGEMEYLGRIDQQVKIRGFRIELGEIENQLLNHKEIKEAVVIFNEENHQDKYLCAYFVSAKKLEVTALRDYLSGKLPGYMIPSYFVPVDKIPLTPNGKLDKKVLPDPHLGLVPGEYEAPANWLEERLLLIWQEVLTLEKEKIGTGNNFFQLGGHSLNAITLVTIIHKELNVRVPLTEVFFQPTIRELAGYIKGLEKEKYKSIEPVSQKEYYALSPAQKRLYILQQINSDSIGYNMPNILVLEQGIDINRLEETFKKLVARHDSLRTSFREIGGEPVQRIHEYRKVEFKIEYYDLQVTGAGDRCRWEEKSDPQPAADLISSFIRPFDLARAPLLRVGLIKENESRCILMFDMHHIITDGTSQQVLTREFILLYTGRTLPPLRLQYKDYSEWQNNEEQKGAKKTQEMYWLKQFRGKVPLLDLPTDYKRPGKLTAVGKRLPFRLGKELVHKLKPILSETETTLFMLLLAAYYVLLFIYTRQEDIIVGSPVGGRKHDNLQNIVGMFVNMLAIRNQPQPHKTFKEFLKEVKGKSLEAFENQEYQFEELVDNLDIKRDLGRRPLVETVFTLQSTFNPGRTKYQFQENGLKVKPYPYEVGNLMFDLTLDAVEIKDSLEMWWTYAVELFKSITIDKFKNHYIEILEQAAANINVKIKDIKVSHDLIPAAANPLETDGGDFGF